MKSSETVILSKNLSSKLEIYKKILTVLYETWVEFF